MDRAVFEKLAEKHGMFEISYRKRKDPNFVTWGVVTADLDCAHIQKALKTMKRKPNEKQVLLWNWRYDSPLLLDLDQVVRIRPMRLDRAEAL